MKKIFIFFFIFLGCALFAQHQTKSDNQKEIPALASERFLIIPFLPKLYNSQIDYLLNKESGKTSRQLAEFFRDGINESLFNELKKRKHQPVDLMADTVKNRKELASIYRHTYLEYMPVPNQDNYVPPKKEVKQKGIKDGQIVVEAEVKDRFMNAKISDARLIPALHARYKTNYFIFINQMDIFSSPYKDGEIQNVESSNKKRLVIHYTVYSLNADEVNSGIAECIMDEEKYSPDGILKKYIRSLAKTITDRIEIQLKRRSK
ncbi:MAG: hypothetical protein N3F09_06090 [Bacteroidia bacterium]|nr:hypothetical protein [Bacteroidia bacterium]